MRKGEGKGTGSKTWNIVTGESPVEDRARDYHNLEVELYRDNIR